MNNRLVTTSTRILHLLSTSDLSTNDLILQTSSDRTHVEACIKSLVRARLIKRIKSPTHRQKKINQLDNIGKELSNVILFTYQYQNAFEKFWKSCRRNYYLTYDKVNINSLKGTGWTDRQVKSHLNVVNDILLLVQFCLSNFLNILLYLRAPFSSTASLAQAILDNIIIKQVSKQLALIQSADLMRYHMIIPTLNFLTDNQLGIDLIQNRIIGNEVKDLLGSLLNLVVIPSGEKNLTNFVERYFAMHPDYHIIKQRKNETGPYDEIMRDLG